MTCARFAAVAAHLICGTPREAILRAMLLIPVAASVLLLSGVTYAQLPPAKNYPPATKAQIESSIEKAIEFLNRHLRKEHAKGAASLAAYALVKAGHPPDDPGILATIDEIKSKIVDGKYKPRAYHFYESGVDILALEAVAHESGDPKRYNTEIQAIVDHILEHQAERGSWFYLTIPDTGGDTSISQYCMLGLWAASRAGIRIPPAVWQRSAHWHLRTQRVPGNFTYHPGEGSNFAPHSMTVNGVASLCIARMHLFPGQNYTLPSGDELARLTEEIQLRAQGQAAEANALAQKKPNPRDAAAKKADAASKKADADAKKGAAGNGELVGTAEATPKKKRKKKFGILEYVDQSTGKRENEDVPKPAAATKASVPGISISLNELNLGIARGALWLEENFTIDRPQGWQMYYLYGLERMSALAGIEAYRDRNWYQEGAAYLVHVQRQDGGFDGRHSLVEGTSFALLFLTNATSRLLSPTGEIKRLKGGLLVGNRGLPEDLSQVNAGEDGVKKRKMTGPVDELLAQLESTKSIDVEAAQQAIVEQVQLGDREALVGQRERLLKLVDDPRIEVRRTAVWALSRCGTLDDSAVFIRILKEDPDLSVAIEANNALCWVSNRPSGVGKIDPFEGLDEGADDKQKLEAATKWRVELVQKWTEWFASVQTYRDREFVPPPRIR